MVTVETSDGVIWNPQHTLLMMLDSVTNTNRLDIDLASEGPCCNSNGLDDLIDVVVNRTGISKEKVSIYTSNQVASSRYTEIRQGLVELDLVQSKKFCTELSTLEYRFGMFVGRSNWLRLALASYIDQYDSNIRYHYDFGDYHSANFGLEELLQRHPEDIDSVVQLVKQLPIRDQAMSYPILWDQHALDLNNEYRTIFCDIVTETFFSGRVFFFTEKLMRAIGNRRPFLLQGSQWALRNLKKLGFKTFDRWWDEGYDEDPWDYKYQALKQNIDQIGSASAIEIAKWYEEMQPVLDHNYHTLTNLTNKTITETEFYYE